MDLITSLIFGILIAIALMILLYEEPSSFQQRFKKTAVKKEGIFKNVLHNLQEQLRPISEKNAQATEFVTKTKKLLLQAGEAANEEDIIKFETKKIAGLILLGFLGLIYLILFFSVEAILAFILFLYLAYKWPEIQLKNKIKLRQKEFMKYLPDAVDLLSICVQAGLGLDAAFSKVAQEFELTSETIAIEFDRLNKDILAGLSRRDAYQNLVLRNENQDLQTFVALLIQTDKLGTSITQSLESFCDSLRTKKRQRIEELSQQASTKMTVPMVLFMLPAIFIVIIYPAIQKIMTNLN